MLNKIMMFSMGGYNIDMVNMFMLNKHMLHRDRIRIVLNIKMLNIGVLNREMLDIDTDAKNHDV